MVGVRAAIRYYSGSVLEGRLQNREFGRLIGAASKDAYRIVRDNGGLDISGEYGSLEISDKILSHLKT